MQAKLFRVSVALVPTLLGAAIIAPFARAEAPAAKVVPALVRGDYAEARSASVYAGACHYNGELTTAGREAVLAWRITGGSAGGVNLAGVRVVAVVAGGENLAGGGVRSSVVYVDSAATDAQREAVVAWLTARAGAALGQVAAVRRAGVQFDTDASQVTVHADGAADLRLSRYPCSHCRMPAETWYAPLAPTEKAEVAQGISTGFHDKTLAVSWQQTETDNAFVGTFSL